MTFFVVASTAAKICTHLVHGVLDFHCKVQLEPDFLRATIKYPSVHLETKYINFNPQTKTNA